MCTGLAAGFCRCKIRYARVLPSQTCSPGRLSSRTTVVVWSQFFKSNSAISFLNACVCFKTCVWLCKWWEWSAEFREHLNNASWWVRELCEGSTGKHSCLRPGRMGIGWFWNTCWLFSVIRVVEWMTWSPWAGTKTEWHTLVQGNLTGSQELLLCSSHVLSRWPNLHLERLLSTFYFS